MPSVIIYRDHFGFQPSIGGSPVITNGDRYNIVSYIAAGLLHVPIFRYDCDVDDFGNKDRTMNNLYLANTEFNYRWFQIDSDGRAAVFAYHSQSGKLKPVMVKASVLITGRSILIDSDSSVAVSYYRGLIEANATLEQINDFERSYYVGEGCPFVWTHLRDVMRMLDGSTKKVQSGPEQVSPPIPDPIIATTPTMGNIIPIPGVVDNVSPPTRTRRGRKSPAKKDLL